MTIFFGLGNNENKYLDTKHNIGRVVVEEIAKHLEINFGEQKGCHLAKNNDFWSVYSDGYMNLSGEPFAKLLKYYKVDPSKECHLILIQDDSDQLVGRSKLTLGGGSAGHNGIISIYREMAFMGLDQSKIWRLKIGIRPEGNKLKSETFVLGKFSPDDTAQIDLISNKIIKNLELFRKSDFGNIQKVINTNS